MFASRHPEMVAIEPLSQALWLRLQRLQQRYRWKEVSLCLLRLLLGLLLLLWGLFVIDWRWRLSWYWRAAIESAVGLAWLFLCGRFLWPAWHLPPALTTIALQLENRFGLRNDLVAALDFSRHPAPSSITRHLQAEVIRSTYDKTRLLAWEHLVNWKPVIQLARLLTGFCLLTVTAIGFFPEHAGAYWQRLCLKSARYPTRTQVTQIWVNHRAFTKEHLVSGIRLTPTETTLVELVCQGECPDTGGFSVVGLSTGQRAWWELERLPLTDNSVAHDPRYQLRLPALTEPVLVQLELGDAWEDPWRFELAIPLQLEWTWHVETLRAAQGWVDTPFTGALQVNLQEGDHLRLELQAQNKPLELVRLHIDQQTLHLHPRHHGGYDWQTPEAWTASSPGTHTFSVDVQDGEQQVYDAVLQGLIVVVPDPAPSVSAQISAGRVLPQARPRLTCRAHDDRGLARVGVKAELMNRVGTPFELVLWQPAGVASPSFEQSVELPLSTWELQPGDQLTITVWAEDLREAGAPQRGFSSTIPLEIVDQAAILEQLREWDRRAVDQLETMIRLHLGTEATP
ncbi:MAG: hypothetical protein KatS3mg113_0267 [Planctomycetaceae bacterium]|nr:MAG: hypothetical protein KatS3mg113_0267 [Planctomycetaceae bacterium]